MKLYKKVNSGIPFVKKAPYEYEAIKYEADIKGGDIITILDGGNVESGQYGEQTIFRIKTRNGEKKLAFNQKTINVLIEEFGDETEKWIGRQVKVLIKKDVVGGRKVDIVYLIVDGWILDEYGDLIKLGENKKDEPLVDDIPF